MAGCIQGVMPYKDYFVFYGSARSCSTGGCWQCLEIPTICEQVLQHFVAMLVGKAGQVKRNR